MSWIQRYKLRNYVRNSIWLLCLFGMVAGMVSVHCLRRIEDLGGWSKVNDELFDPENGSIAKIEEDAGVSTEK